MNRNLLVVGILLLAVLASSGCINTGKGVSIDTLYGCENNGFVWKTYSCWLTNDHPTKDYSAIYTLDNTNTTLINKVIDAENSGKKVRVYYHNEAMIFPPWTYTSNAVAIIDDIEAVP